MRFSFTVVAKHLLLWPSPKKTERFIEVTISFLHPDSVYLFVMSLSFAPILLYYMSMYMCICMCMCGCMCVCLWGGACVFMCVCVCMDGCVSLEQFESLHVTIKQL